MEDSFIMYRTKPKKAIISSDEEEDDDDELLESSQTVPLYLDKTRVMTRGCDSQNTSDSTIFDPDSPHDKDDMSELSSFVREKEAIEVPLTTLPKTRDVHHFVRNESVESNESLFTNEIVNPVQLPRFSRNEIEESDEVISNVSEESDGASCNDIEESDGASCNDIEESDSMSSCNRLSDKLHQNISDISFSSAEESKFAPSSTSTRRFREAHKKPEVEQLSDSTESSKNENGTKKISVEGEPAELSEVSIISVKLEENKELPSSFYSSTTPDDGKRVSDSGFPLESIKQIKEVLLAEPVIPVPQPEVITPGRNSEQLAVDRPLFDITDEEDCAILEDNVTNNGVSINNIRTILKEKVSQNGYDIVNSPPHDGSSAVATWSNLPTTESDIGGFGKRAMQTHLTQQSLTVETLTTLHSALKACPSEDTYEEDPYGLKVELMPHQKHALAWLLWRERARPSGGILADDMGLGKTLTMISLVLKSQQEAGKENIGDDSDEEDDVDAEAGAWLESKRIKMPRGGTLVVCPASLVGQWEQEIKRRCDKGLLSVLLYHGTNRETRIKRIARKDFVITTYNLMSRESGVETAKNCTEIKSSGPLHNIKWRRIILDEAHIVRNHKSQTALGVFELSGKHRWCLTGTPIQNKELDLFSLLKFLRCSPFDDLAVWKRWVDNKNAAGMQRLSTMMKSLMLRRTKEQLHEKGALQDLPKKEYEIISVNLDPDELKLYKKIALFSSTLFMQFLGQRAEKDQYNEARWGQSSLPTWEQGERPDNQYLTNQKILALYSKMKMKNTEVKSHQILVLLLRLRQICCHPGLIKEMLKKEDFSGAGMDDDTDDLDEDLFSALEKLEIGDENTQQDAEGPEGSKRTSGESALSPDNPILDFVRPSSKIRAVLDVILEKVMESEDKAVVVSQWTSMLNIIHEHLREMGVKCEMLSGNVPVAKRMELVNDFNGKRNKFKVLLLSLTAGGVGLNLIGGNHLFLIDVHWNPQLEAQACDRVYRVGQTKPVHIYKFVCKDTIEERIKKLQDHKLALAENVLTGTKNTQASKLTLQDLKMLFGVGLSEPGFASTS